MAIIETQIEPQSTIQEPCPISPEGREQECISLAFDLVKQRLQAGTASSAETVHFLRLATQQTALATEKLRRENDKIAAQTEAIESTKHTEELISDALASMRSYQSASLL